MASTNVAKNAKGYGYKYTDLSQIHNWLELNGITYYQTTVTEDGVDYIYTTPIIEGKELPSRRGCRVVIPSIQGKTNEAQALGSALTYARRYSLLMAFGLATEDDDAAILTNDKVVAERKIDNAKIKALSKVLKDNEIDPNYVLRCYKVTVMENLTEAQHDQIINNLDKVKQGYIKSKENKNE